MATNNSGNISSSGMVSYNGTGTFNGRTLTAGTGISISNGDGISGNPTISSSGNSGSFVFLSTQSASSSSSIVFSSGIDSTYTQYMFLLTNIISGTNGAILQMQVSNDGGSTWRTTGYVNCTLNSTTTAVTTYIQVSGSSGLPSTATGCSSILYLVNPASSATKTQAYGFSIIQTGAPSFSYVSTGGQYDTAETHNAVRFLVSSGNIASGTFTLYGIKQS